MAIITGSSSGIGYETSLALAENGFITYTTMRDTKKGSNILEIDKVEVLQLMLLNLMWMMIILLKRQ